ncbi:MAG: hypothetical protein WDN01_01180 [Rhizomicrobium sp.]
MKHIRLDGIVNEETGEPVDAGAVIVEAITKTPAAGSQGINPMEQLQRIRIIDAVLKRKDRGSLDLEDADYDLLVSIWKVVPFLTVQRAIIELTRRILAPDGAS